jgi:CIC family chloride channel protein
MLYQSFKRAFNRFIAWLQTKLNTTQFLIALSIIVGISAGLMAVLLKTMVHTIHELIFGNGNQIVHHYWWAMFPMMGILLTIFFVRNLLNGQINKGTASVLYAIAQKSSRITRPNTYAHVISSGLTVGCGGSAGLEAPIVVTGSALGSNLAQLVGLNYRDRSLLLACGAAAGIGAAFNAPITGVVFALEILLTGASTTAYVPLMVAAVCGALCSKIILDENILFSFVLKQPFDYHNLPYYFLLANIVAFVAIYYARSTRRVEHFFKQLPQNAYLRGIIGGGILFLLMILFPSLFGEGYSSITLLAESNPEALLHNSLLADYITQPYQILVFIAAIALVKVFATAVTLSSGGNGGNFAPSLFVGGYVGFLLSRAINMFTSQQVSESNFIMVGMAGMLSGVFYAPLSAIFLILELTHGYELMIPIMLVSALVYAICRQFEPYSMDTKRLAEQGLLLTRNKDENVLNYLKIEKLLETNFETVSPDAPFSVLLDAVTKSKRNIFPVVDDKQQFVGFVLLENILPIMFTTDLTQSVADKGLIQQPPAIIQITDTMQTVMKKFDDADAWNLPVVEGKQYKGFITKSNIFKAYRQQLIHTQQ